MYLFEDFLMFRLAVVRLFLLTGPFSPSSSSSSPRFDQNRKTQMWKMWCINWSQKARLVITSDNHSQSTKLLHKDWLGSDMMKLSNISQPCQPGNAAVQKAYKEWKHGSVYSQLRKECGYTIQRQKYQLSAARLVYIHEEAKLWCMAGEEVLAELMHGSWSAILLPDQCCAYLHVSIVCLCTGVSWQVVIIYRCTYFLYSNNAQLSCIFDKNKNKCQHVL